MEERELDPVPACGLGFGFGLGLGLGSGLKRVGAQIRSLGAATGGLVGCVEAAGGAAQDEGERPGPWPWQGGQCGAAAAERGRPPCQPACGYSTQHTTTITWYAGE